MTRSTRFTQSLAVVAAAASCVGTASGQAAPAAAPAPEPDWTFSSNVGIFSQYVFRGISQTNEKPAIQGGFDVAHKSGFYVGTWASNISWISDGLPDASASMEWDFYGGYKFALPIDFSGDVGVLEYYYPGSYPAGATKADTTELYAAWAGNFCRPNTATSSATRRSGSPTQGAATTSKAILRTTSSTRSMT